MFVPPPHQPTSFLHRWGANGGGYKSRSSSCVRLRACSNYPFFLNKDDQRADTQIHKTQLLIAPVKVTQTSRPRRFTTKIIQPAHAGVEGVPSAHGRQIDALPPKVAELQDGLAVRVDMHICLVGIRASPVRRHGGARRHDAREECGGDGCEERREERWQSAVRDGGRLGMTKEFLWTGRDGCFGRADARQTRLSTGGRGYNQVRLPASSPRPEAVKDARRESHARCTWKCCLTIAAEPRRTERGPLAVGSASAACTARSSAPTLPCEEARRWPLRAGATRRRGEGKEGEG